MINLKCPACQAVIQVSPRQVGSKMDCPWCNQRLQVPGTAPTRQTTLAERLEEEPVRPSHRPAPSAPVEEAPPVERQWYYTARGERQGPVGEAEVRRLVRQGDLRPRDLVWSTGMKDWRPAEHYFEFPPDSWDRPRRRRRRPVEEDGNGQVCSLLSCIFGGIAFLLCPPVFGLAGLVLGIVGVSLSRNKALGIIGIVLSVVGTIFGMVLGFALMNQRF